MTNTELDQRIIAVLEADFPLVPNPYAQMAEKIGISEAVLLSKLTAWSKQGIIRKLGAVLTHRQVGYQYNALCLWEVPTARENAIATQLAQFSCLSHCYTRQPFPQWPYNLYAMLHAHDQIEAHHFLTEIAKQCLLPPPLQLCTVKEWKKTSMRYALHK